MPEIEIKVKSPTFKEMEARYKKRAEELKVMKTPNKRIAIFLDRWVQLNFRTEGGNVGGWKPLALGGRFVDGILDTSAKILQDTRTLQKSFLPFATNKNAGIGSDLDYAKPHEEGLNGLPRRRILPKNSEVRGDVKKLYTQWVEGIMK